jgi:hypothetical protein
MALNGGDYCGDASFCDCRRNAELAAEKPLALRCAGCAFPYAAFPLDVVLPDEQWLAIAGQPDGLVLCAACIVKRGSKLPGVTVAKLVFE